VTVAPIGLGTFARFGLVVLALLALVPTNPAGARHTSSAAPHDRAGPIDLTGRLLVAAPDMPDPRFARTVIFMVRHDASGAMGIVVNRLMARGPLAKLLEGFGVEDPDVEGDINVYYGGPVEPQLGFVLHTADYVGEHTIRVRSGVALTTDIEILSAISAGKGPRLSLFAMGYAGWAAGQLERELMEGGWIVVDADEGLLFDSDLATKWDRALAKRGVDL